MILFVIIQVAKKLLKKGGNYLMASFIYQVNTMLTISGKNYFAQNFLLTDEKNTQIEAFDGFMQRLLSEYFKKEFDNKLSDCFVVGFAKKAKVANELQASQLLDVRYEEVLLDAKQKDILDYLTSCIQNLSDASDTSSLAYLKAVDFLYAECTHYADFIMMFLCQPDISALHLPDETNTLLSCYEPHIALLIALIGCVHNDIASQYVTDENTINISQDQLFNLAIDYCETLIYDGITN